VNSHRQTASSIVIEIYMQAANELFTAYGLTASLKRQEAERRHPKEESYVSSLSGSGESIRLLSTLSMGARLLASMHPSGLQNVPRRDLEDWCRELNNQLVGRTKNKLLRLGCELATGLPSLVTGTDVSAVAHPDLDMHQYHFASDHGCLTTTLAMMLAPDIELKEVLLPPGGDDVKPEGTLAIF
jgi:hypothetical protein